MKMADKEKIVLAITPDVKLYECFLDNLNYLGFEVYLICNNHFKYRNLKDKLVNFYRKKILSDKSYKRKLAREYNSLENIAKLSTYPNTDYSLTIRADLFDEKTIKNIVLKSNEKLWNIAATHAQSGEKNLSLTTNLEAKVHMFDLRSG